MSQSLNFGKSVSDNGWGMFTTFLKYKLEKQGKKLVKVDRFFASSQTCSVCGYKNVKTKNLLYIRNHRHWLSVLTAYAESLFVDWKPFREVLPP